MIRALILSLALLCSACGHGVAPSSPVSLFFLSAPSSPVSEVRPLPGQCYMRSGAMVIITYYC